jgi:hypothetical protein
MSYWPKQVARELNSAIGYSHNILKISDEKFESYLKQAMRRVPIEKLIGAQK